MLSPRRDDSTVRSSHGVSPASLRVRVPHVSYNPPRGLLDHQPGAFDVGGPLGARWTPPDAPSRPPQGSAPCHPPRWRLEPGASPVPQPRPAAPPGVPEAPPRGRSSLRATPRCGSRSRATAFRWAFLYCSRRAPSAVSGADRTSATHYDSNASRAPRCPHRRYALPSMCSHSTAPVRSGVPHRGEVAAKPGSQRVSLPRQGRVVRGASARCPRRYTTRSRAACRAG